MPAVPVYQQQSTASGSLNVNASEGAFGGYTAQAMQRVGGALQDVASAEQRVLQQQKERDARSWVGSAVSTATLDWQKNMQDRQQNALPGAPDFTGSVLTDFDAYKKTALGNAPTPAAKEYLDQHLTALRTSLGSHALTFESGARVQLRLDQAQTAIVNAARAVQQDPTLYSQMAQNLRETSPGVSPEHDRLLNEKSLHDLQEAAASNSLENAPYDVRAKTEKALGVNGQTGKTGVAWIDEATAPQIKQWNQLADAKIKQIEAGKNRDQDASYKLAVDTTNGLRDFAEKGLLPDPTYQTQVRMLTKGTPWEAEAESLITAAVQGAGHGSQTIPRQKQALVDMANKPTTPELAAQLEKMQTITKRQEADYSADPWAASAKYQRGMPDVGVAQIGNGNDLLAVTNQRIPLMNGVEAASGAPAPLLKPEEVPKAVATLNSMQPGARAETLGRIGVALKSPERITAFADQLGKGDPSLALTLKLGTDGTTAGRMVSELVLRGSQALKDKTVKADDTKLSGWKAEIAGMVRGSLGDPRAESDVINAAYYVRAAMDEQGIGVDGFKLDASARQAVKLVAGVPVERNGVKTLLPRGMEEGAFDTALQEVTAPKLIKFIAPDGVVYLRGQPVSLDQFGANVLRYGLTRDGSGNYIPSTGGAFVTLDKAGTQPLRLPVKQ